MTTPHVTAMPGRGELAPARQTWVIREAILSCRRPLLMGILNVTPDSFSDGGRFLRTEAALHRANEMAEEGADMIDVGGESTRPGAATVDVAEEISRVVPVIRALKAGLSLPVSVDTRKAEVAAAALEAGADIVNDVTALGDPNMAGVVADHGAGLVVMHMRGTPQTMQLDPRYDDVVREVAADLRAALDRAEAGGIPAERVVVDPGIGFGKTTDHNLELMARLDELLSLGCPVLLGPSRKSFIGQLLGGIPPEERAVGTAAACVAGLLRGARIFRVHDVHMVRQALDVAEAIHRVAPTPS